MKKLLVFCPFIFVFWIMFWIGQPLALAGTLIAKAHLPAFNDNPLAWQGYLSAAQIQDRHGFLKSDPRGIQKKTPEEIFKDRFLSGLYYNLSKSALDEMFDEDGHIQPGEYTFDDWQISIESDELGIKTEIVNTSTGDITTIELPNPFF